MKTKEEVIDYLNGELDELGKKVNKVIEELSGNEPVIDPVQRMLLEQQMNIIMTYELVLRQRVRHLEHGLETWSGV